MDTLWLILVLSALLAAELMVGRWLGSEVERHMRRMTKRVNKLNEAFGRQLLPAVREATRAFEDLNRAFAQWPKT